MEEHLHLEALDSASVERTLRKIEEFQRVIRSTLREGRDFGVIPGVQKPSLLKPGAEKVLMVLGLSSRFEILEAVRDYENGFFAFTVRCTLERGGVVVTEGFGHANTREKRYARQDPYTLANTVLKIAKKRAMVDATLVVASLSEIFTQDLEEDELCLEGNGNGSNGNSTEENSNPDAITPRQRELILQLMRAYVRRNEGEDNDSYTRRREEEFRKRFGKDIAELNKKEASAIIDAIKHEVL